MDPILWFCVALLVGYAAGALRWHLRMKRLVHELIRTRDSLSNYLTDWQRVLYKWLEEHAKDHGELAAGLGQKGDDAGEAYQRGKQSALRAVLLHFRGWI